MEHVSDPFSEDVVEVVKGKTGRPVKADVVKDKARKASMAVRMLVASKPSAKDVSEWIKSRLAELSADL
jgi:hypothetical protein